MGHKIFISYKYHDPNVFQRISHNLFHDDNSNNIVTPRDYVDVLAEYLDNHSPHYCKAEDDNNDLSKLSDNQIWEILKDKIYDSTMTIIIISPNMRNYALLDRSQWIPWEVKYSLDKNTRHNSAGNGITSDTNAMMAIVLPDRNGNYSYYFESKTCCNIGCRLNKINTLFKIIRNNTFNLKKNNACRKCVLGDTIYQDKFHSYISFYRWDEINSKEKIENAINHCYEIQSRKSFYDINHEID